MQELCRAGSDSPHFTYGKAEIPRVYKAYGRCNVASPFIFKPPNKYLTSVFSEIFLILNASFQFKIKSLA